MVPNATPWTYESVNDMIAYVSNQMTALNPRLQHLSLLLVLPVPPAP